MRSFRNKRTNLVIGLCTLLTVSGLLFAHQFNQPVTAVNFTTIGSTTSAAPQTVLIPVTGTYANFSYPSTLKPMTGMQGVMGNELAVYNYSKKDIESWHLAIAVNRLPHATLTDDDGYLSRKDNPVRYKASTVTIGQNSFTLMTDMQATGFNEVAFAVHGDMSADISLVGDDPVGGTVLSPTLQQVLASWHWQ